MFLSTLPYREGLNGRTLSLTDPESCREGKSATSHHKAPL